MISQRRNKEVSIVENSKGERAIKISIFCSDLSYPTSFLEDTSRNILNSPILKDQDAIRELSAYKILESYRKLRNFNGVPKLFGCYIKYNVVNTIQEQATKGTLEEFLLKYHNDMKRKLSIIIRILIILYTFQSTLINISHNNLRGNILLTHTDLEYEEFKSINGVFIRVPTFGYRPMIINFTQATSYNGQSDDLLYILSIFDDCPRMMNVLGYIEYYIKKLKREESSFIELLQFWKI